MAESSASCSTGCPQFPGRVAWQPAVVGVEITKKERGGVVRRQVRLMLSCKPGKFCRSTHSSAAGVDTGLEWVSSHL